MGANYTKWTEMGKAYTQKGSFFTITHQVNTNTHVTPFSSVVGTNGCFILLLLFYFITSVYVIRFGI